MAQLTTLARPYARAAFETAQAAGNLALWSQMLGTLGAVVRDEKVAALLASPARGAEQKAQVLVDLCGEALDEQGRNFVRVLAENKRLNLLPEIHELFEELKAEQERVLDVDVVSAFEMSEGAKDKLAQALTARLQRDVKIHTRVDGSLIGGLVVRAGDVVIDGSVRGRLHKLAEALNS